MGGGEGGRKKGEQRGRKKRDGEELANLAKLAAFVGNFLLEAFVHIFWANHISQDYDARIIRL